MKLIYTSTNDWSHIKVTFDKKDKAKLRKAGIDVETAKESMAKDLDAALNNCPILCDIIWPD